MELSVQTLVHFCLIGTAALIVTVCFLWISHRAQSHPIRERRRRQRIRSMVWAQTDYAHRHLNDHEYRAWLDFAVKVNRWAVTGISRPELRTGKGLKR